MPRTKTHPIYLDFIAAHAGKSLSNRELRDRINTSFDWSYISNYGPIPSESVVQKETKRIKNLASVAIKERSKWLAADTLDEPWRLNRIDPDGCHPQTSDWIINEILSNDFIIRKRALNYPLFEDHLHAVTRRVALWLSYIKNILNNEHPQLIWSIAWLYSGHELACLNGHSGSLRFDTQAFDYYLAYRPWKSEAHSHQYRRAIETGLTVDITQVPSGMLHRLQIVNLYSPSSRERAKNETGKQDLITQERPEEQYAQENY